MGHCTVLSAEGEQRKQQLSRRGQNCLQHSQQRGQILLHLQFEWDGQGSQVLLTGAYPVIREGFQSNFALGISKEDCFTAAPLLQGPAIQFV